MKHIAIVSLLIVSILFASCGKKVKTVKKPRTDSVHLTLAIVPTLDCLPLYQAVQKIYPQKGLWVDLKYYASQMDAEQAVANGEADGCTTDLFRTGWLQSQKRPIRFLFTTDRGWELIANRIYRVSKTEQLGDRMIGMARFSTTDFLCDFVASKVKKQTRILRPQINNIYLREFMLESRQIDAAFLPQPQALVSRKKGNTMIPVSRQSGDGFDGIAISTILLKKQKVASKIPLLIKGYNQAVEELTKKDKLHLSMKAINLFHLNSIADSIKTKQAFSKASAPTSKKVAEVMQWLHFRNVVTNAYHGDTLIL